MSSNWKKLKEKGNLEYKQKNYKSAISLYSEAIRKFTHNFRNGQVPRCIVFK